MLMGSYQNSIDAKNRVIVPSKFRGELGERCVLTMGLDNCLVIYPESVFQKIAGELEALPRTDESARSYNRFLYQNATELELDAQGRVLIPANYKEAVGIDKNLVTIGVRDHVEIWAKEIYDTSSVGGLLTAKDFESFSEKFSI